MDDLLEFIGDNPQALEKFNAAKEQFQTSLTRAQDYEVQLNDLNAKFTEAVNTRDKTKNLIRETLGIEEVTQEAITAKLATIGDAEIKRTYDNQLDEVKKSFGTQLDEKTNLLGKYEQEIHNLKLENALAKTDIMGQTKSKYATEQLLGWIKDGAEFAEDGNIIYRGPNGETLYNSKGEPLTLDDRIAEIKADKDRDFVFESRFLNGGGAPTNRQQSGTPAANSNSGSRIARSTMSFEEKKAYVDKYGQDAYQKLPLV